MRYHKLPLRGLGLMLIIPITLALVGCRTQQPEHNSEASIDPGELWEDATGTTIGVTKGWTNKVELADVDGDGRVDVLFANGGKYLHPGEPEFSQVFLNQGPGQMFKEATRQVFGPKPMLARVIKVGDVNGDGDLDVVLADWGPVSPMDNAGGRTMLWLNDGTGHFTDTTQARMPGVLVRFSWELEFVDVDNDYDLDTLVSCKMCFPGSYLFENDGTGSFTDISEEKLPQFGNNYDFEAMDVNGDEYLDLVTINDGDYDTEHIFLNDRQGGFRDATARLWPDSENPDDMDDNMDAFLDFDSDGDADLLIGSLSDPDRLLINDGSGKLKLANDHNQYILGHTPGTLGIALADLNGDRKLDVVQAQGEGAWPEKVFLGKNIKADTAPPVITQVENVSTSGADRPIQIRARVHDNKSPTKPHDWRSVVLRWSTDGQTHQTPMQWYGEYLWRGIIDEPPAGDFSYEVCAMDAAGNEACAP